MTLLGEYCPEESSATVILRGDGPVNVVGIDNRSSMFAGFGGSFGTPPCDCGMRNGIFFIGRKPTFGE